VPNVSTGVSLRTTNLAKRPEMEDNCRVSKRRSDRVRDTRLVTSTNPTILRRNKPLVLYGRSVQPAEGLS